MGLTWTARWSIELPSKLARNQREAVIQVRNTYERYYQSFTNRNIIISLQFVFWILILVDIHTYVLLLYKSIYTQKLPIDCLLRYMRGISSVCRTEPIIFYVWQYFIACHFIIVCHFMYFIHKDIPIDVRSWKGVILIKCFIFSWACSFTIYACPSVRGMFQ